MPDIHEIRKNLEDLLVEDLAAALQTAKNSLPESSPKSRQVLLLIARHAGLDKDIARGVLLPQEIEQRTNQIRSSFIDLVAGLAHADLEPLANGALAPVTALAPKFVVVYAQEDQGYCTQLNRHLNILKLTGKIKLYNVNEDTGGENTLERARREWENADYMLALITVNLFNAPDWFNMVYDALGQGRRVIPIRIQRADYEGTGLEKLRSLPSGNRAVSDFSNADEAYTDIVKEIRRLLPGS